MKNAQEAARWLESIGGRVVAVGPVEADSSPQAGRTLAHGLTLPELLEAALWRRRSGTHNGGPALIGDYDTVVVDVLGLDERGDLYPRPQVAASAIGQAQGACRYRLGKVLPAPAVFRDKWAKLDALDIEAVDAEIRRRYFTHAAATARRALIAGD